ncbi:hypothetical protein [Flagellimonas sp. CMM7]|uniref:hypothetical protein n=1 Tax=Flagellimonas sp. CMM7 TaxID=2654676 RepID=UPI0013D80A2F|nr:hypothetical protein [Flagellimonas sp. CMM7]UII79386.1 hypothetical protein LV704_17210 [Flagellimonas sp. CMM7]
MKNTTLITLLFLILACGPEAPMFDRQYVIQNSSSFQIVLQFYKNGEPSRYNETLLNTSNQLEGSVLTRSGGPWDDLAKEQLIDNPVASLEADSITVIFNKEKKATYTIEFMQTGVPAFNPANRNLLRDTDYVSIGKDKFLFQITDSDYEGAEPCIGDCN